MKKGQSDRDNKDTMTVVVVVVGGVESLAES